MDVYKIRKKTGVVVEFGEGVNARIAIFVGRPVEDVLDPESFNPPIIHDNVKVLESGGPYTNDLLIPGKIFGFIYEIDEVEERHEEGWPS